MSFHKSVKRIAFGVAIGMVCALGPAEAAPILTGTNTSFSGVRDLLVNGTSYDVSFQDGTCASVFGICDAAHFQFHTQAEALEASNALLGAIAGSIFDDEVSETVGCDEGPPEWFCLMVTPYDANVFLNDVSAVFAANERDRPGFLPPDEADPGFFDPLRTNYKGDWEEVFAVWSPHATISAPEPVTISTFGAGLLGMGYLWRRKKTRRLIPSRK